MKTRVVLYGENDEPVSILGDNPQEKAKKAWNAVIALLATTTDDIMRVESVEVWDDTPQTELYIDKPRGYTLKSISDTPQTDCPWK